MTSSDDRQTPDVAAPAPGQAGRDPGSPSRSLEQHGQDATALEPRSVRPLSDAWVGGVCAGLADHLGWSVLVLRVLFVVLAALGLVGVAL